MNKPVTCVLHRLLLACSLVLLAACVGVPKGITPVDGFDESRYLGTWYEVARLDHSFERGMSNVTATYSVREDGGIDVLNRGYREDEGEWDEAKGRAYFVEDRQTGYLKVSFFGPFYGAYVVFGLDKQDYGHAFVAGPNRDYLWLLARTPEVEETVMAQFLERAGALGFATEALIFPSHNRR